MRLHCLGTVGYHPNESRHTSSYFLPQSGIALDAGTGFFRVTPLLQTDTLDILLSHAHLDHTFGLTFLLDVMYQRPLKAVRIWGTADKLSAIREHLFHELIFPAQLDAEWIPIDDLTQWTIGSSVQLSWRRQHHPGGSVAYRIDWPNGKRLIYATDTSGDTSEAHAEWSREADLLMHECYFRDSSRNWASKTGHTWSSRVAEVANASRPKKLLLTHINPLETADDPVDRESIQRQVSAEVILAEDELVVDF